jgi:4-hydroxy-tetrahydrodipicolinate synthase
MAMFTGSGVAIVTPFNQDKTVNFDKLRELIDWQIKEGTDSIVICGTTGEASTLDDDEHLECVKVAVEASSKRVPVIAGTGSNDTHHGISLSKQAEKLGADGLLQVTPYYNKTTQRGLIAHFGAIANSVDIPIMLYNVPSRTGMKIDPKTVTELLKIENIVAMKEASGDIGHIVEVMSRTQGDLDLYSGNDDQIIPLLSLGGKGVVSVLANILPKDTHDIVDLYMQGKYKESLDLQLKLHDLITHLFIETNPIPVKEAMNLMNLGVGPCRLPLYDMDPSNIALLKAAMIRAGVEVKK